MSLIGTQPYISHELFLKTMLSISTSKNHQELMEASLKIICFKHAGYHHIPAIGSYDYPNMNRYWTFGLPKETLDYFETIKSKTDPVMEYCFRKARPFWLSEILDYDDFTDTDSRARIKTALKFDRNSIIMPLYGPFHKLGYAYLGFNERYEFFDDIFIWQVQSLMQATHIKYCLLQESVRAAVRLTNRESEVLELITFGKTNPEIGDILGISTSTVSGYVKQIFLKLDVSDRVSAALRARNFNPKIFS